MAPTTGHLQRGGDAEAELTADIGFTAHSVAPGSHALPLLCDCIQELH
jgi:hypothetical protein